MTLFKKTIFVLAALVAFGASAQAQPAKPAQLRDFEAQGGIVEYLGNEMGLDGWVVISPDKQLKTVYTTPQGGLVMGILVDEKGANRTGDQLQAYRDRMDGGQAAAPGAEKSTGSKVEQVYAEVEKSNWVAVGAKDAPYLYMFMNVSCDHCQKFWNDLKKPINAGLLQVRLVPFGKTPLNREGGAALLSVDDPAAAFDKYIAGDKATLAKENIKDGAFEKIDANTKLFADRKMQGPPFSLYRKPADGSIAAVVGRPENVLLLMAELVK